MVGTIQIWVILLGVIGVVAVVAPKINMPVSILLVLTGALLAMVPGLPTVALDPDLVLLLVLPPVIYETAVAMSWREFRFNLRPIALLAVGCVTFTTLAVAAAAHYVFGLSWPVGFVLGAVVSPPDAVAPLSIARDLQLPRRLLVILEGEGLANDATALVLYRFAIAAVGVGAFSLPLALETFSVIVLGEIAWGIGVGWAMLRLRRWIQDPQVEVLISILTPFIAYWPPERVGGSGVLATVAAGLYISWNGLHLISAATRLQGVFFWQFFTYLIEGLVFMITGLQARRLFTNLDSHSLGRLAVAAAAVSAVVIVARFVWIYPLAYLPRLIPFVRRRDPSPPWQWLFALSFTGIRGIVSLAAALAIPFQLANGEPFPDRDLILSLTFVVIFVTLVGQGLLLPYVIRALELADSGRRERQADQVEELSARRRAVEAAIAAFDDLATQQALPAEAADPIRAAYEGRRQLYGDASLAAVGQIERSLIGAERRFVNGLHRRGELKDEGRRRIERDLDLREAQVANWPADDAP